MTIRTFVILTLNELALEGLIARVEAAVEAAQDQVSAGAVQQREAAKALAEQVIAGGVEALARGQRQGRSRAAGGRSRRRWPTSWPPSNAAASRR